MERESISIGVEGRPIQCCTGMRGKGEGEGFVPSPITAMTHVLLRDVGLLKCYEEVIFMWI